MDLAEIVGRAFSEAFPGESFQSIRVVPATDAKFGDYQCNDALKLAKSLKKNPREVGAAVAEKLALAPWLAVKDIALFIGADMHTDDEKLAVLDRAVGILQVYRSHADTFDLCAEKSDTCLVLFVNEVIVIGFFVLSYDLTCLLFVSHGQVLLSCCLRDKHIVAQFFEKSKSFVLIWRFFFDQRLFYQRKERSTHDRSFLLLSAAYADSLSACRLEHLLSGMGEIVRLYDKRL